MSHDTLIAELSKTVRVAQVAQTPDELGAIYADLVGYDLHADDPSLTADELRDYTLDMVRENCYQFGIHVSRVGLSCEY